MIHQAIAMGHTQTPEAVLFWVLGPLAVLSALAMLMV